MAPSQQPASASHAPTLESFLHSKLHLDACIETAVALLKRRQVRGAEPCALATAHVLAQVVSRGKWSDVDQLLDRVHQVGHKLVDAQPQELVIGNIVRRVLGLIRDEAEEDRQENNGGGGNDAASSVADSVPDLRIAATTAAAFLPTSSIPPSLTSSASFTSLSRTAGRPSLAATGTSYQSMFNLLSAATTAESASSLLGSNDVSTTVSGASTPVHHGPGLAALGASSGIANRISALRDEILDGIDEIKDEVGQADDQIAGFAESQVRPGDVVMACAPLSRTVEKFLLKAAARRRYTLFLVDGGGTGAASATFLKRLAAAKATVVQIDSGAVAAYMPRVGRVVLEARAMAANGGILAGAGGARLARAARALGKPVLAVGGVYRLSPEPWTTDPAAFVEWAAPAPRVPFADGSMVDGVDVESAATEYVPPQLVDIYVTNLGPHSKDYLESVIADHYKNEDLELYRQ